MSMFFDLEMSSILVEWVIALPIWCHCFHEMDGNEKRFDLASKLLIANTADIVALNQHL